VTAQRVLRRHPDVLWVPLLDGVLVEGTTGDLVELNTSAAVVWDLLAEPADVDDVVSSIVEAFGVDAAVAREQVLVLTTGLLAQGLIAELGS
jgi:hypothetical protein